MDSLIDFCFKGDRNYVHGTDMLMKFIEQVSKEVVVTGCGLDLNIHKITKNKLRLVSVNAEEVIDEKNASANIYLNKDGKRFRFAYFESDTPIECRYEYEEDRIIKAAHFDNQLQAIQLEELNGFTTIEKIVALNKGLLNKLFPAAPGKWYFTKIKLKDAGLFLGTKNISEFRLQFRKNFNFKLTASAIFVNNENIGEINFSLV